MESRARVARSSAAGTAARQGWRAVAVLAAIYAVAMADRQVLSMLIGPLKHDLGIGDFQAGLLLGPAFALTYVLCIIPIGLVVDRVSRRWLLLAGMAVWTVATGASALATSFVALFMLRSAVGCGEAVVTPLAHSLLGDLFPPERRAAPFSIFQAGGTVGGGLGIVGAGLVLDWHLHQPSSGLFGAFSGWQLVFLMLILPGIAGALLIPLLPEPPRGDPAQTVTRRPFAPFLRANRKVLICIFLVFGFSISVTYAQGAWTAEYVTRQFGWSKSEIGLTLGSIDTAFALFSHLVSGFVADRLTRSGKTDAPLRIYLIMAVIALPFAIGKYLVASSWLFILCTCMYSLLLAPTLALGATALQQFTPPDFRGRISAMFIAFISIVGLTLGPSVTGAIAQFGFKGADGLGHALASVTSVGVIGAIVFLILSLPKMREAVALSEQ
jgi:MFS family permease